MNPGEFYKVVLPGETPWAQVVAVREDGTWEGRIDNKLVGSLPEAERAELSRLWFNSNEPLPSLHNYKQHDVVRLGWSEKDRGYVPLEQPAGRA